jgi:hypothetical protein
LGEYLRSNSKQIVDFINRKYIPTKISSEPNFDRLASELQGIFPHQHGNEVGKRDRAHDVLAMAIICSLWCGWLSRAKANRGAYLTEWPSSFKKLIVDAFEIGQQYSKVQP